MLRPAPAPCSPPRAAGGRRASPSPASPGKASHGLARVSQGDGPLTPWGQWLCPNEEIPEDLSKASTTMPGARCGTAGTLDSVQPVAGSPGRAPPHQASRTRPSCEARGSWAPVRSGVHVRVLPAAGALRCGLHPLSAPAGQAPSSLTEPPLGQAGPPASRPGPRPLTVTLVCSYFPTEPAVWTCLLPGTVPASPDSVARGRAVCGSATVHRQQADSESTRASSRSPVPFPL